MGVTKQRQCNISYTLHCASQAAICTADNNTSESWLPSKLDEGHLLTRTYGSNIYADNVLEKYLTYLKTERDGPSARAV